FAKAALLRNHLHAGSGGLACFGWNGAEGKGAVDIARGRDQSGVGDVFANFAGNRRGKVSNLPWHIDLRGGDWVDAIWRQDPAADGGLLAVGARVQARGADTLTIAIAIAIGAIIAGGGTASD